MWDRKAHSFVLLVQLPGRHLDAQPGFQPQESAPYVPQFPPHILDVAETLLADLEVQLPCNKTGTSTGMVGHPLTAMDSGHLLAPSRTTSRVAGLCRSSDQGVEVNLPIMETWPWSPTPVPPPHAHVSDKPCAPLFPLCHFIDCNPLGLQ